MANKAAAEKKEMEKAENKALVAEAIVIHAVEQQCSNALGELQARVAGIEIISQEDYSRAVNLKADIKRYYKKVEEAYKSIKDNAYKLWKEISAKETSYKAPAQQLEKKLDEGIQEFLAAQRREAERIAQQEQLKAIQAAEKEKARLLGKADKAKTEEARELLQEQAENVYVAPVLPQVATPNKLDTGKATATQRKTLEIVIVDEAAYNKAIAKMIVDGVLNPLVVNVKQSMIASYVKSSGNEEITGAKIYWSTKLAVKI